MGAPGKLTKRLLPADMLVYSQSPLSPRMIARDPRAQGRGQRRVDGDGAGRHRGQGPQRRGRQARLVPPLHARGQRQAAGGLGPHRRRRARDPARAAQEGPGRQGRLPAPGQRRHRPADPRRGVRPADPAGRRGGEHLLDQDPRHEAGQCPDRLHRNHLPAVGASSRSRRSPATRRRCRSSARTSTSACSRRRSWSAASRDAVGTFNYTVLGGGRIAPEASWVACAHRHRHGADPRQRHLQPCGLPAADAPPCARSSSAG